MSTGDLLYSDTEDALRDSVRQLFAERCTPESVTRVYDTPPQDFSGVWRTLAAELGVAGRLVPESLGAAGVEVSPLLAFDMTRPLANVRFSGASSTQVGSGNDAVHAALEMGAALLASEQLGVAQWCFDTTLAYSKERKQFGREIGSYQA